MSNSMYEIEYGLISSMLAAGLTPRAREVMSWLEPEMFATFQLGALYGNIRKQARKDDLIDILLLAQDYGENFANLAELASGYAYSGNILGYAKKVHSAWVNRTAQQALLKMAGLNQLRWGNWSILTLMYWKSALKAISKNACFTQALRRSITFLAA